jgi:hypothetical protein
MGFLAGEISVPDDFDQIGRDEIELLFSGSDAADPAPKPTPRTP